MLPARISVACQPVRLHVHIELAQRWLQAALLQLEAGAGFARLLAATASPEAMHHPAYDDTEAAAVATMVCHCPYAMWRSGPASCFS
jgi:hypothetical protein